MIIQRESCVSLMGLGCVCIHPYIKEIYKFWIVLVIIVLSFVIECMVELDLKVKRKQKWGDLII